MNSIELHKYDLKCDPFSTQGLKLDKENSVKQMSQIIFVYWEKWSKSTYMYGKCLFLFVCLFVFLISEPSISLKEELWAIYNKTAKYIKIKMLKLKF